MQNNLPSQCKNCENRFRKRKGGRDKNLFCSIRCATIYNNKKRTKKPPIKCKTCKKNTGSRKRKYCTNCSPIYKSKYNDKEIKRLFEEENLGARKIAKILNIKHYATVTKRLKKLKLLRGGLCIEERTKLNIEFLLKETRLWKAAEHYLRYLCELYNFDYAIPKEESAYDLLVDFGNGLKKIQVKSSYQQLESGNYSFYLMRSRQNSTRSKKIKYTKDECDYFFLHSIDEDSWLIPFKLLKGKGSIVPELRFPGYKLT